MKKLLMCLSLICLATLLCCFAAAAEANFYTVTYDSNGHGSAPSMQSKMPGVNLILTTSTPIASPYTFYGWAASPDADSPDYLPGDTYSLDQDITLYAVWKDPVDIGKITDVSSFNISNLPEFFTDCWISFTVSKSGIYRFHSSGNFYDNSQYTAYIHTTNQYGYLSSIASSTYISDGSHSRADFAIAAELTAGTTYYLEFHSSRTALPLHVTRESYTVTYDSNGHGGAPSMQSKVPGVALTLTTSKPIASPYTFYGWAASPDADTPDYLPGDTYSLDQDITLYAVWRDPVDIGTITAGASFSIGNLPEFFTDCWVAFTVSESGIYRFHSSGNFYDNSQYTAYIHTTNQYGYLSSIASSTYIGDGSNSRADFAITAELTAGTTYYLEFHSSRTTLPLHVSNDFYTVTYDSNGHGGAPSMQSKVPGVALTLTTSTPIASPYTFYGWAASPDADVPDYLPGDIYSLDQNITLYAVWKKPVGVGEITGKSSFSIGNLPEFFTDCWVSFTVSESGIYRFHSSDNFYDNSQYTAYIHTINQYGYLSSIASSTYISDGSHSRADFAITAELAADTTYYLEFHSSRTALPLHVTPQYSDPDPYGASSAIPRGVSVIADGAFEGCGFDSFQVPAGTSSIGARAFANCPNLRKVVVVSANVSIDPTAFEGCTDLLIVAPKNSTAHQYAKAHGLEFRELP